MDQNSEEARVSHRLTYDWSREIVTLNNLNDANTNVSSHKGYKKVTKPWESYCTGSTYAGTHDALGFSGYGVYVYPHGVKYEGAFKDGNFDGDGVLSYPNGDRVKGTWVKGKLQKKHTFQFSDGLEIEKKPWKYLKFPDRSFAGEKNGQIKNDMSRIADTPKNCYTTGDGYFDPVSKIVYDFHNKMLRIASKEEEAEIVKKFPRNLGDPAVGYLSHLFEFWISGRNQEIAELEKKVKATVVNEEDHKTAMPPIDFSVVFRR